MNRGCVGRMCITGGLWEINKSYVGAMCVMGGLWEMNKRFKQKTRKTV